MAETNELSSFQRTKLIFAGVESDIIEALKTLIFPYSSKDSMHRVERLLSSRYSSPEKALQVYFANKLIQEFVSSENEQYQPDFKNKSSYQREMKILLTLFDYFGSSSSSSSENALKIVVLLTFFNSEHPDRWSILVKLVSMAISVENEKILMLIPTLTHQRSFSSEFLEKLVGGIVHDFLLPYPNKTSKLEILPVSVPVFCILFMTKVTELYGTRNDKPNQWISAPTKLLKILIGWIENYSFQFISILNVGLQLYLPDGLITIPVLSPYSGLLKWTILSSIYEKDQNAQQLFIQLHLSICKSLSIPKKLSYRCLISTNCLMSIIGIIQRAMELDPPKEKIDDCLIRLAQNIQIGMHYRAVHGDLRDLSRELEKVLTYRHNRLLRIVVDGLKDKVEKLHDADQLNIVNCDKYVSSFGGT